MKFNTVLALGLGVWVLNVGAAAQQPEIIKLINQSGYPVMVKFDFVEKQSRHTSRSIDIAPGKHATLDLAEVGKGKRNLRVAIGVVETVETEEGYVGRETRHKVWVDIDRPDFADHPGEIAEIIIDSSGGYLGGWLSDPVPTISEPTWMLPSGKLEEEWTETGEGEEIGVGEGEGWAQVD